MKRFSDYHPAVLMLYFAATILLCAFSSDPVTAALALLGSVLFCAARHTVRLSDLGFYLGLGALIALSNPLFVHNGVTPLFFMNDHPVTLEAIVCGIGTAVTLIAVLLWCRCYNSVMTSDKFLYLFGRVLPRSALIFSMALRYVPLLRRQAHKTERAQTVLGLYTTESWLGRVRAKLSVLSALIGWSLENAIAVSAAMKARGYGAKGHTSYSNYCFTWRDGLLLALVLLFGGAYVLLMQLCGTYAYYPSLRAPTGAAAYAAYAAFAALSLAPFLIETEETLRWNYLRSKI